MSNNASIAELVEIYLSVSSISSDEHDKLAQKSFEILQKVFKQVMATPNEPIILPYKDISDIIFQSSHHVKSNSLESFQDKVTLLIDKFQEKPRHKTKGQRLRACHRKLVGHIMLAYAQKEFMQNSVKQAQEIAQAAQIVSQAAKATAETAQDEANKANDTYKSMFANYVTILGVFTAIIVTIFGGLNVVSVVAKQADTPLANVVFLTALALMCVVSLLYFLANIIINITQQGKDWLNWLFGIMIAVCVVAMIVSWCMTDNKKPLLPKQASVIQ